MIINTVAGGNGGGSLVSAYALGTAKGFQEGSKVVLNYAADMFPASTGVTSSLETTTKVKNVWYVDRNTLLITNQNKSNESIYADKQSDGSYKIQAFTSAGIQVAPNGVALSGKNFCQVLPGGKFKFISNSGSSNAAYSGWKVNWSSDYNILVTGYYGSSNYLTTSKLDQKTNQYGVISTSLYGTSSYSPPGVLTVKSSTGASRYFIVELSNGKAVEIDPVTGEQLSTTVTLNKSGLGYSVYYIYYRFFDNDSKLLYVRLSTSDAYSIATSSFYIADVSVEETDQGNVTITLTDNTQLTSSFQACVSSYFALTFSSPGILVVTDDKDISYHVGGTGFICRYENGGFTPLPRPFEDNVSQPMGCYNAVEKIAANWVEGDAISNPVSIEIRSLDVPIEQPYIAIAPGQTILPDQSITGFVKTNSDGILQVEAVEDPNKEVPTYPDTYGLQVVVTDGSPAEIETWTQPAMTSATTYGNCTDSRNNTSEGQQGWKCLDGSSSTNFVPANGGGWWKWSVPDTLTFTAGTSTITIVTPASSSDSSAPLPIQFFADEAKTKPITDVITIPAGASQTYTYDVTTTQSTTLIYMDIQSHSNWAGIGEITFNGVTVGKPLDEGSAIISRGWWKGNDIYYKWSGAPSATLSENVVGDRANTMGLYLAAEKDTGDTVAVISKDAPSADTTGTLTTEVREPWVQPAVTSATSDGTIGTDVLNFTAEWQGNAWSIVDGVTQETTVVIKDTSSGMGTRRFTWTWDLPEEIFTSSDNAGRFSLPISLVNRGGTSKDSAVVTLHLYSSSGVVLGGSVIGNMTTGVYNLNGQAKPANAGSASVVDSITRIVLEMEGLFPGGDWLLTLGQLKLTGFTHKVEKQETVIVRGDYKSVRYLRDIYLDSSLSYILNEKPVTEETWVRPNCTSDTSNGVISYGCDDGITAETYQNGYLAVNSNVNDGFNQGYGFVPAYWQWELPETLSVTPDSSLTITFLLRPTSLPIKVYRTVGPTGGEDADKLADDIQEISTVDGKMVVTVPITYTGTINYVRFTATYDLGSIANIEFNNFKVAR